MTDAPLKVTHRPGLFASPLFWVILVLFLFSTPLIMSFRSPEIKLPTVLGALPDFTLQNQENRSISYERDLRGAVLVANFIFTRCPDVCPTMSRQMMEIQGRLKGTARSIQLVSFTVDPEFDNPEVLKLYGQNYKNDPRLWHMLTGPKAVIHEMARNNFKAALGTAAPAEDHSQHHGDFAAEEEDHSQHHGDFAAQSDDQVVAEILHAENFFLIDQVGQIRDFMQVRGPNDVNRLMKKLAVLVNTNPPRSAAR